MMIDALKIALNAADSKKASDIVAMDISGIATFTDYFLICTGDSSRQMHAIADEVEKQLAANGIRPSHVEGYQNAEWILMDFVDLVRLWRDGKELDTDKIIQVRGTERKSKNVQPVL
jgi:ribosome-associated protein